MSSGPGRWTPAQATRLFNEWGRADDLVFIYKKHAKERLGERSLYVRDLVVLVKTGFVYDAPMPDLDEAPGFFKYAIEGRTPNSNGRVVRVIVTPKSVRVLKVITIMWKSDRR